MKTLAVEQDGVVYGLLGHTKQKADRVPGLMRPKPQNPITTLGFKTVPFFHYRVRALPFP